MNRSSCIAIAAAALIATVLPALADSSYFVSPAGNDGNDCLTAATPCATIQRAVDIAPAATHVYINLTPGTYDAGADVTHYKFVSIYGDCSNRHAVTINTPAGGTAFIAQDYAVLGLQCVVINGGLIGIKTRQFSILDYVDVTFGPMSIHVAAGESSKINCGGGTQITGSAVYHYAIGQKSQIAAGCDVTIPKPVAFSAFAWVVQQSYFDAAEAKFSGSGLGATTGLQFIADGLSLVARPINGILPGSGFLVSAGAMAGSGGDLSVIHSEIKNIQAELKAFRTAVTEQRRKDRMRDGVMAGLALLAAASLGVAAYALYRLRAKQ